MVHLANESGGMIIVLTEQGIWDRLQRFGMTVKLDLPNEEEMYGIIRSLNADEGVAVCMVTHDVQDGLRDAKSVLVMDKGVSFFGSSEDYARQYDARGRKRDD